MSVQVSTRIDEATKKQFDKVCEAIGISPSNALSVFIKGVINHNGIPFNATAVPEKRTKITKEEKEERSGVSEEFEQSLEKVNRRFANVLKRLA